MFTITLVCTGNRNRSPIAEACIRREVNGLPVEVDSLGLMDLGPAPPLPESISVAQMLGLDISRHRARPLSEGDLNARDLILGLEWQHVAAAVVDGGAERTRSFTLLELVDLIDGLGVEVTGSEEDARSVVAGANTRRGSSGFSPELDILDPFGGPQQAYVEMARTVERYSRDLIRGLFGPSIGA